MRCEWQSRDTRVCNIILKDQLSGRTDNGSKFWYTLQALQNPDGDAVYYLMTLDSNDRYLEVLGDNSGLFKIKRTNTDAEEEREYCEEYWARIKPNSPSLVSCDFCYASVRDIWNVLNLPNGISRISGEYFGVRTMKSKEGRFEIVRLLLPEREIDGEFRRKPGETEDIGDFVGLYSERGKTYQAIISTRREHIFDSPLQVEMISGMDSKDLLKRAS